MEMTRKEKYVKMHNRLFTELIVMKERQANVFLGLTFSRITNSA